MQAIPASVVIVRVSEFRWKAYVRYTDRFLDKDLAASTRYTLNSKIDYLFRETMRDRR